MQKLKTKLKQISMLASYYLVILLILSGSLSYGSWVLAKSIYHNYQFVIDPVSYYGQAQITIPKKEKELPMREWVLDQWEKVGQRDNANLIIQCESSWSNDRFNINKKGGTVDLSLYQFNTIHLDGFITMECLSDYKCSTIKAIELWKKRGWSAWACSKYVKLK